MADIVDYSSGSSMLQVGHTGLQFPVGQGPPVLSHAVLLCPMQLCPHTLWHLISSFGPLCRGSVLPPFLPVS